ncbi:MAG: DnaA/Hda family protein, partial [Pseudomonadota bacterium]
MWITFYKAVKLPPFDLNHSIFSLIGFGEQWDKVGAVVWQKCLKHLEAELTPQQYNTWIRPLQVVETEDALEVLAPNRFVLDWIKDKYFQRINALLGEFSGDPAFQFKLTIGSNTTEPANDDMPQDTLSVALDKAAQDTRPVAPSNSSSKHKTSLKQEFTFDSFVEGKSNQLARAASLQVAENTGKAYNPLFITGGVGLGKTHLMHAVGNQVCRLKPNAKVVYLHSERFVQDMVKALQQGTMQDFMQYYRSVDALLIDDIQFFAKKLRSQEEFFHVFNALLERDHQMVLTCDR